MPYKDIEKAREQSRLRMQKHRGHVTPTSVTPPGVTPDSWQKLADYIKRPLPGTSFNKMSHLERLQRVAGSLGQNAGEVYFGNLNMKEIGDCIGTMSPLI